MRPAAARGESAFVHRPACQKELGTVMDEGALESSSEEGSSLDEPSWVSWFCMLRNHEFFCEVDPAFVQDRFNLYGLKEIVGPLYGEAMTMILGYAPTGARMPSWHAKLSLERGCTK